MHFKLFAAALLLLGCSDKNPEVLFDFPDALSENSGIALLDDTIWAVADSGNPAVLYGFDRKGNQMKSIDIKAPNKDWEDLTTDAAGNLYIGDFGNNKNKRQDLVIYKVAAQDLNKTTASVTKTEFYFPEQQDFPPKKPNRIFDVESFFEYRGNFYLFTKNRSSAFDGSSMMYRVPNQTGRHAAQKMGSFTTCDNFNHCAVTSAAISPDGKTMALLSADYVWLFTDFKSDAFLGGNVRQINLGHFSQKEGLCFDGNGQLLISDEKTGRNGGKLYRLPLSETKP